MDNDDVTNKSKLTTKSFACDACKNSFKTKQSLNIHKRIHSGENPYKCDICDKRFTQKCHLKQHMLVHSGNKKVQCHFCGKIFLGRVS